MTFSAPENQPIPTPYVPKNAPTSRERPAQKHLIDRVAEYIEEHYARPISLRDVAAALGYSSCHLTTSYREATGIPVTAAIIKRRIAAACVLLGDENLDVAATCEIVGFSDLCYFTRQFVRHVGITPGRYRAMTNGFS